MDAIRIPIPEALPDPQAGGSGSLATELGRRLEPGQILRASVLELGPKGRVLLGLFGSSVEAKTEIPLLLGQELQVEVASRGDSILLRPLPSEGSQGGSPAFEGAPWTALQKLLPQLLQSTAWSRATQQSASTTRAGRELPAVFDPGALAAFHESMGVGFERRILELATLRGAERERAVQSLRESLRAVGGTIPGTELVPESALQTAGPGALLQEAAHASDQWRSEQAVRAKSGAPLVYPIPLPGDGELTEARLFLLREDLEARERDAHGEKEGGASPYRVILLLRLESLGDLRVDLTMAQSELMLRFVCTQEHAAIQIQEQLDSLKEEISGLGLRLSSCKVKLERTGHLPLLDLLPPRPRGLSNLDVEA